MSGSPSDRSAWEPSEVEDTKSGQRYLMYRLPIAAWPFAPHVVYECPTCRGCYEPSNWSGDCPGCAGHNTSKRRREGC